MRVVQSLGWYFPQSIGGSEVYVSTLVTELRQLGWESTIAAPIDGVQGQVYMHQGTPVYRYPVLPERTRGQIRGTEPHGGFDEFRTWLDEQPASVYHQHSMTFGCGVPHLEAAKARGLATVLTIHVPGLVCLRGTMLRDGKQPCDGLIRQAACAACWLQQRGMPDLSAALLSKIPSNIAVHLRNLGRAGTALGAAAIVDQHETALMRAVAAADQVVAVCQWLLDALLLNGVPRSKLTLNRHGVLRLPESSAAKRRHRQSGEPLVVGFLGRGDPLKGLDTLVRSCLALDQNVPVELHVHVVESDEPAKREYMKRVQALAALDRRVQILPPLAPAETAVFLKSIDILAVPSLWLETGPLVVLEAFAAGTPVLGSSLGGIAELVQHGTTGWLVPHDNISAWAAALHRLASDPAITRSLSAAIGPVRTVLDVAHDTSSLYGRVLAPV